ncbi:discoidin domain-containing protein [Pontibacter beigongshangensis]|uniref:discoidin domain-containing protein n=1 Tax=Pontibacter beigongshangensis TaxID=2574733 RepID=UPI0019D64422|nr:discoidin domain-containing protein [Pontibacter beigongshangensis]
MFPTYFDKDGLMYSTTSFGDYPHFAPAVAGKEATFTGWMLLSCKKPVKASSAQGAFKPEHVTDENVKTFWVAENNSDQQWVQIDLQKPGKVHALQVNFHDYKSNHFGKHGGLYHRYLIEGSADGNNWTTLVDKSNDYKDVPND